MKGGKVSRNPTARSANEIMLIFLPSTVSLFHALAKKNQTTSQTTIVTVVTPESVPVGL